MSNNNNQSNNNDVNDNEHHRHQQHSQSAPHSPNHNEHHAFRQDSPFSSVFDRAFIIPMEDFPSLFRSPSSAHEQSIESKWQ